MVDNFMSGGPNHHLPSGLGISPVNVKDQFEPRPIQHATTPISDPDREPPSSVSDREFENNYETVKRGLFMVSAGDSETPL